MQKITYPCLQLISTCAFLLTISASSSAKMLAIQEPARPGIAKPDSILQLAKMDSLQKAAPKDTLRKKPIQRTVLASSLLPAEPTFMGFQPSDRIDLLYEDVPELFAALAGMRISRSGDLGQFAQVSYMAAPARFTSLQFDQMEWPVGLYGQTNLSAVPEVLADAITLNPGSNAIRLQSVAPGDSRPWTHIEYVKGPFDVDVMRVRFKRSLSKKIQPYFSLNLANSNGQQTIVGNDARGGPYDATRMYLRTDYLLSADLRLRYRFLSTVNEAVVATPYFFEELPDVLDSDAHFKEKRILHALAVAKSAAFSDTLTKQVSERDLYRFEIYHWANHEETRDDFKNGLIEHKNNILGGTAKWSFFRRRWSLSALAKLERHNFTSPTITEDAVNLAMSQANAQLKFHDHLVGDAHVKVQHHTKFGSLLSGSAQIAFAPANGMQIYAAAARTYSMPGPAEYANELPGILTGNTALESASLDKIEIGIQHAHDNIQFSAALNHLSLQNQYVLAISDTVLQFQNAPTSELYWGYSVSARWLPFAGMQVDFSSNGTLEKPSAIYDFWYLPRVVHRLGMLYGRALFQNDLHVAMQLSGQYWGAHQQPIFATGALPSIDMAAGGFFADGQIKLIYKDAVLFFRLDNFLNEALKWRQWQQRRGRAFRYGIYWEFWN